MIDRRFWEDARKAWVVVPPPKIKDVKTGSGGTIDPSLLVDPWSIKESPTEDNTTFYKEDIPENQNQTAEEVAKKPTLDKYQFDELMAKHDMPGYIAACRLLIACELPDKMSTVYGDLIEQMGILGESVDKFKEVYHTDLVQFYEYYIPEALQLTATYLEYIEIGIDDEIVHETESEVLQAIEKLLLAVREKKDEIYKFASMEIKAKAKALEALMSQDGFVDPAYKI